MAIAVLCCYAALLLHTARRTAREGKSASHFFVNDRSSGAVAVALSLLVSCVGASATMGMAGMAFRIGTPAFWWLGAGAVGLTLLSVLLAGKVRESGAYTMPEMASTLLGSYTRPLISGIIVIAWMAILAAQFTAMARLLSTLLGVGQGIGLAFGFVLIVFHTLGGQAVLMRTDGLQSILLFSGLAILLVWLNAENPGWCKSVPIEAVNDRFSPEDLTHYLFVVGGNYLVCPMLFGRFLCARDIGTARAGGLLAGVGLAGSAVVVVMLGLACRGLVPADTSQDAVLTTAMETAMPDWLAVAVLIALISAVVSSADSCLLTAATVFCHDLLRSEDPLRGRACVLILGGVGLVVALEGKGILDYLFMGYDMYVAGVVMPVFVAILFSRRRLARPGLAVAAIGLGGCLGGGSAVLSEPVLSYAGMAASTVLTLAGLEWRRRK